MCITLLQRQEMKAAQRKMVGTLERSLDDLLQQLEGILQQVETISAHEPDRT